MSPLGLTSQDLVWIGIAIVALIVIAFALRFFLSLAMGLIRLVVLVGGVLILLYVLYTLFIR